MSINRLSRIKSSISSYRVVPLGNGKIELVVCAHVDVCVRACVRVCACGCVHACMGEQYMRL